MQQYARLGRGQAPTEKILFPHTFYGKYRVLAVFLILSAVFVAAFSFSGLWLQNGGAGDFLKGLGSFRPSTATTSPSTEETTYGEETTDIQVSPPSKEELPEHATPLCAMDLSYRDRGADYLLNETLYRPLVERLLEKDVSLSKEALLSSGPLVLILHTHTSEAYPTEDGAYFAGDLGETTYSSDATRNMLSVGKALSDALNQKGIPTIHCTVTHDVPSLQGSYERAAESIRFYRELYPSIQCVIDLHRDAVMTSTGELVKSLSVTQDEPTAQIMAVVGSDGNGTPHESWEENLALALRLRALLNADGRDLGRPVALRNASYNQELAPYSLLLEIGTSGNTLEEALRSIPPLADALEELLLPDR